MAFTQEPVRTPNDVGDISVVLFDPWPDDPDGQQAISYGVIIHYDNGERIERTGNLAPHLTAQQITALQSFMASLRTQAESEFLP